MAASSEYGREPSYAPSEPGSLAVRKAVLGSAGSSLVSEEKRPAPPPREQPLLDIDSLGG